MAIVCVCLCPVPSHALMKVRGDCTEVSFCLSLLVIESKSSFFKTERTRKEKYEKSYVEENSRILINK